MTIAIPDYAATFFLVFARVGVLVMLLPGLGERTVPGRTRLGLALLVAFVMFPAIRPLLPGAEAPGGRDPAALVGLLLTEVAAGFVLGLCVRILTGALQVAGSIIAQELGLSYAMTVDPTQGGGQEAAVGNFLTLLAVALIFATDLHHVAIRAIGASYGLLPPGAFPPAGDMARLAVGALAQAFALALQMAAPFIAFSLLFNLGTGILSRLMPQMQVFFLVMPLTILVGFGVLGAVLAAIMALYLGDLGRFLAGFGRP